MADTNSTPDDPGISEPSLPGDCRLYRPDQSGWQAHILGGGERQYCYTQAPGQDHFHLILPGELFVQKGDEKLCLMCALREGVLTTDRLFWQHPVRKEKTRRA
jgi:hypothetical protein